MQIRFRAAASADMRMVARESRRRWGDQQTATYIARLRDDIKSLADYPERYPEFEPRPGLRRMNSGRHAVFYLVGREQVEIIRVLPVTSDLAGTLGS